MIFHHGNTRENTWWCRIRQHGLIRLGSMNWTTIENKHMDWSCSQNKRGGGCTVRNRKGRSTCKSEAGQIACSVVKAARRIQKLKPGQHFDVKIKEIWDEMRKDVRDPMVFSNQKRTPRKQARRSTPRRRQSKRKPCDQLKRGCQGRVDCLYDRSTRTCETRGRHTEDPSLYE